MDKPPEKQSRFAKRLARIKSAREIPPTPVKRAIALAFGAIIALGALYLGLVSLEIISFSGIHFAIMAAIAAGLGALIGWRAAGIAGLSALSVGLWLTIELAALTIYLVVEILAVGLAAALSTCSF